MEKVAGEILVGMIAMISINTHGRFIYYLLAA